MEFSLAELLANITSYIDKKHLTIKTVYTEHDYYRVPHNENKEENLVAEACDINGTVFSELLNELPDSGKHLADITQQIETITKLHSSSHGGFGGHRTFTSYKYFPTDGELGTLRYYYTLENHDEFGIPEDTIEITVEVSNVIYKNHKYYFLSKELEKWLAVEGKPKRSVYLRKLTYEF